MLYTIDNNKITLKVDTKACEMHSLKRNDDDYEYLWNGDEKYWKGRNPILFPQISSTSTKTNIINGKEYPMGNHGFARNSEFTLVDKSDDTLTFLLKENEETLKQYPYSFNLYVTYTIKEDNVTIKYCIENTNDEIMPFGFGLHPAFNVDKDYMDTKIVFDNGQQLTINKELFEKYPTYYEEPTPSSADLYSNNHHIKLEFEGFKHLAIWSPFAPFVCVEPWNNLGAKDGIDFEKRAENINLAPKQTFEISYKIRLLK